MNNTTTPALEGRKQEQRPENAKEIRCFAKVRDGHLQNEFTCIPKLFETAELAQRDMMAPMESYVYPMTLLPTEDHALLLEQNAEMRACLEQYAYPANWKRDGLFDPSGINFDGIAIARAALSRNGGKV